MCTAPKSGRWSRRGVLQDDHRDDHGLADAPWGVDAGDGPPPLPTPNTMLMRAPHAVGVRNLNIVLGEGEGGDDHDEEEDENEYEHNVDDKHKSVHWEMKTNM